MAGVKEYPTGDEDVFRTPYTESVEVPICTIPSGIQIPSPLLTREFKQSVMDEIPSQYRGEMWSVIGVLTVDESGYEIEWRDGQ